MFQLNTELAKINGIGQKFLARLAKLQIKTVRDLLWHFPFRYEDYSKVVKIDDLQINQSATVRATVQKISVRRTWRRKMLIVEALLVDETGGIKAIWFNQPYVAQILKDGVEANFAGKVTASDEEIYMSSPAYEVVRGSTSETKHTAGLIPIYPETRSLTSKGIRFLVKPILNNLETIPDFVPSEVLESNDLPNINTALKRIHFPFALEDAEIARKRFAFEDLFLLQLNNLKIRLQLAKEKAPPIAVSQKELDKIIASLPFELTASQKQSLDEIVADLSKPMPMNRLLQGDVGSGKTVIVAIAGIIAAKNNKQTAFMAPTEVLARQHYQTLTKIFGKLNVGICLLTSNEARSFYGDDLEGKRQKSELLKEIEDGKIQIIIGTHAIISSYKGKPVMFRDLALAIIDEQHRFGVEQRAALVKQEKDKGAETTIHFLSMSATPIPRTLSLTLFGDLDLSIINELPKGRKPIITKVVDPKNRPKAYEFIREHVKAGRQVFVIYPRIEPSSKENTESKIVSARQKVWNEVKAVKEEYEKLSTKIFPDLKVGMLHGKLKAAEKEKVMSAFSGGDLNILVSTSVIEVGVDVPNATIMVIEGADRFGLSQLYQFRGRVGRSEHQSFCFLFTDSSSQTTAQRLDALLEAKNGFELAEKDLAIRGPGQFLGDKQTGIPDLAMRALNNIELIKTARSAAEEVLKKDPTLKKHAPLRTRLKDFQKQIHLE
ncbi:MAG: ATP-dependent DNA helicase RecG [bacterium]|nr:ATP-dependent DNA helicase RecG [bacterium]